MTNSDRILRAAAEEAIDDVTEAFINAIDSVVEDPELAIKIKEAAQINMLNSILKALTQSL